MKRARVCQGGGTWCTPGNVALMTARTETRYRLKQRSANDVLLAIEPTAEEVREHAPALAAAYNDPHNGAMMAHTTEMSPADAFLLAAKKEKLAVQFYETWSRLYPEGPERSLLLSLAEIERRHKTKVEELFTNAAFPEAW